MERPDVTETILAGTARVERVRSALRERELDGLLVTNPENRRYLSGFSGHDSGADSAGQLVVTDSDIVLITDGRYIEQAARECPGLRVIHRQAEVPPLAAQTLVELGARRIGVEAEHLTLAHWEDFGAALAERSGGNATLVSIRQLVEPLRAVKDADELTAIERAVAITDDTFSHLSGYLRPGLSERQVAREIERYMLERGAEGMAFAPIVASGPNAALPHAEPADRKLGWGEPIIIDMGARYAGYCADFTRTICLGQPGPEGQAIYDLVLQAQEACERGTHAGMTGQQSDALARGVFEAAGRGDQYLHGTGHGLGLEIHEAPRVGRYASENVLAAGMAVTIEPGLYVPGWGGVRIEDTVVVADDGVRVLTQAPKHFVLPVL
jgi:Xaa-Pro aminopeptidase